MPLINSFDNESVQHIETVSETDALSSTTVANTTQVDSVASAEIEAYDEDLMSTVTPRDRIRSRVECPHAPLRETKLRNVESLVHDEAKVRNIQSYKERFEKDSKYHLLPHSWLSLWLDEIETAKAHATRTVAIERTEVLKSPFVKTFFTQKFTVIPLVSEENFVDTCTHRYK